MHWNIVNFQVVADLELKPVVNSEEIPQVIHGTYKKHWFKIRAEGLNRMSRNHIHFATGLPFDKEVISGIRRNVEVFIYIDVPKALAAGIKFYQSTNGVVLSPGDANGVIKPDYFLKVFDEKGLYFIIIAAV